MPIDLFMTQLSPTMKEGKIVRWLKNEGDELASGEVLAEIETDKTTMELEVVDEGILHRIIAPEGSIVPVGEPIAVITEESEEIDDDYRPPAGKPAVTEEAVAHPESTAVKPEVSEAGHEAVAPSEPVGGRIKASPVARRLASQAGIDLSTIRGTGPRGRIVKADVEKAAMKGVRLGGGEPVPPIRPLPGGSLPYHEDEYDLIEHSMIRRAIARRLTESKQQVPHFYLSIDVAMDRLLDLRTQLNQAANGSFKLSVNDLIIKAVAKSLIDVPAANASWSEKGTLRHKHAHISVAVAIEGGLITPVVRYADRKSVVDISEEVKVLVGRAREGALKPEEYAGGTFTISNLGMFGIKQFAAIINSPEGALLAVGATEARAVVEDGGICVRQMMSLTLSCDHRVVDGTIGSNFLAALKRHLETPAGLLL